MQFNFMYFGGLLVIFILKAAKANIPGCNFSETVNISSSLKLNGSYVYQGHLVPFNLIAKYDFIEKEPGIKLKVKSHVRGCVCKLKPCLWYCCRFKDMQTNGECTDDLMEELNRTKPSFIAKLDNGSRLRMNLLSDFIVLRDQIRPNDTWNSVDSWGSLRKYSCLHPNQFISANPDSLVYAIHTRPYSEGPKIPLPGEIELIWFSEAFLIFTMAVYLYVKKLRNLHGKCFISYMITTFLSYLQLGLTTVRIPLQLCSLFGYWGYYINMANFLWLLAMGHQLWKAFTSVNRAESQYSFRAYSLFSWGTAAGMTGLIFLIDQIWEGEPNKVKWIPGMGWDYCDLKLSWSTLAYLYFPITILIALNTTLFILTTISIVKVKLSLNHFSDQNETARNHNSRMQTLKMFLRLIILMDLQWSVYIISLFFQSELVARICSYCSLCNGIIIFVVFALKRRTIRLLMESIRNGRK